MKLMKEAMDRIDGEINLGTFSYSKYFPQSSKEKRFSCGEEGDDGITFREYAQKWYRNNKVQWKPSVRKDFRSTMEGHLIPYFGDQDVSEITKPMIKEYRTTLSELKGRKGTLSNKRNNNITSVLRLILNEAAEEFQFTSPFADLKPLPLTKPEILPLSLKEVFLFLEAVVKAFHNYYIVRFFTGMRTAEIDGLKWRYIDFVNKKILIRETWQNNQWVPPKTKSSIRDIDMSKMVEKALLDQKCMTGKGELVFCNKNDKPFDYNNISNRIWYPTLKKAGLAPRNAYQTRHTAATLWLASGENPEWIAKQMGHADSQMLFTIYSKFIPNLTRRDGSAFERLFERKLNEFKSNRDNEETGESGKVK
jgi:integrase